MKKLVLIVLLLLSCTYAQTWSKHCVTATLSHSSIQGDYMNATLCASINDLALIDDPKEDLLEILMPMHYDKTIGKEGLDKVKRRLKEKFGNYKIKVVSFYLTTLDAKRH